MKMKGKKGKGGQAKQKMPMTPAHDESSMADVMGGKGGKKKGKK